MACVGDGLCRYRVIVSGRQEWQEDVVTEVSARLFRVCGNIQAAYRLFDMNDDGTIEYSVNNVSLLRGLSGSVQQPPLSLCCGLRAVSARLCRSLWQPSGSWTLVLRNPKSTS
jgi:hypothetical protein